jgi:hypothetical protein
MFRGLKLQNNDRHSLWWLISAGRKVDKHENMKERFFAVVFPWRCHKKAETQKDDNIAKQIHDRVAVCRLKHANLTLATITHC